MNKEELIKLAKDTEAKQAGNGEDICATGFWGDLQCLVSSAAKVKADRVRGDSNPKKLRFFREAAQRRGMKIDVKKALYGVIEDAAGHIARELELRGVEAQLAFLDRILKEFPGIGEYQMMRNAIGYVMEDCLCPAYAYDTTAKQVKFLIEAHGIKEAERLIKQAIISPARKTLKKRITKRKKTTKRRVDR